MAEYLLNKSAVFFDRDGVLNKLIPLYNGMGKLIDMTSPKVISEFEWLPGAVEAVKKTERLGFLNIIVTNQPGCDPQTYPYSRLPRHIQDTLPVDRIIYGWDPKSSHYKPGIKHILPTIVEYKINVYKSYFIGDRYTDVDCGSALGCKTIFIGSQKNFRDQQLKSYVFPDYIAPDITEAVNFIEKDMNTWDLNETK